PAKRSRRTTHRRGEQRKPAPIFDEALRGARCEFAVNCNFRDGYGPAVTNKKGGEKTRRPSIRPKSNVRTNSGFPATNTGRRSQRERAEDHGVGGGLGDGGCD